VGHHRRPHAGVSARRTGQLFRQLRIRTAVGKMLFCNGRLSVNPFER
jgi:hypothetical protein